MEIFKQRKQNLNKNLLNLLEKYEKGELKNSEKRGLRDIFINKLIKRKKNKLYNNLVDHLINFIPQTDYPELDSLNIEKIIDLFSKKYYESNKVSKILIIDALNSRKDILNINGRYYIYKDKLKNYKKSYEISENLINQEF